MHPGFSIPSRELVYSQWVRGAGEVRRCNSRGDTGDISLSSLPQGSSALNSSQQPPLSHIKYWKGLNPMNIVLAESCHRAQLLTELLVTILHCKSGIAWRRKFKSVKKKSSLLWKSYLPLPDPLVLSGELALDNKFLKDGTMSYMSWYPKHLT
jgi:hypothetical protein